MYSLILLLNSITANAERKKRLAEAQAEKERKNAEKAARRAAAMAKTAAPTGGDDDDDDDDAPSLAGASGASSAPALPTAETDHSSSTPVQKFTAADGGAEVLDNAGENADGETQDDESKGMKPSVGNGGKGPHHEWTQTLKDLVIMVPVPLGRFSGIPSRFMHDFLSAYA